MRTGQCSIEIDLCGRVSWLAATARQSRPRVRGPRPRCSGSAPGSGVSLSVNNASSSLQVLANALAHNRLRIKQQEAVAFVIQPQLAGRAQHALAFNTTQLAELDL